MSKGAQYFTIIVIAFGGLFFYTKWQDENKISLLTSSAVKPDLLLDNTKFYLKEHAYERSLEQLDDAIIAMRNIEADLDSESTRILEVSITDLEKVRMEMEMDSLVTKDLNEAFSKALNALTLAELKISEMLIKKHQSADALVALKYGMLHVKNALRYSEGKKKAYEIHIYEEIDSLLDNKTMSQEELIAKLEFMIAELDTLVEGNVE